MQNGGDIFMIYESNFIILFLRPNLSKIGYTTAYRFDRNRNGCGILLSITEDIPSKTLGVFKRPMEGFFIELNLYKMKW